MTESKPRVFIFDGPVSCSKLFRRVLSTHTEIEFIGGYPYLLAATRGPEMIPVKYTPATQERLYNKWKNEVREEDLKRWQTVTFDKANDDVRATIKAIEERNHVSVVQEHAAICVKSDILLRLLRDPPSTFQEYLQTNPTVIQEDLLQDCCPIILFRHPALFIPSLYRKQKREDMLDLDDEAFQQWVSLDWIRLLYDYFTSQASSSTSDGSGADHKKRSNEPIVVEAQDLVHDTENVVGKLCRRFGVDPSGVKYTWDVSSNETVPEGVVPSFHERLRNSTGIETDDATTLDRDIDVDQLSQKWKVEFGDEIAQKIRQKVDGEMPTYWYLFQRKT